MPTYPKRPPLAVLPLCPMFLVSIILCYDVISGKTIENYRCHKCLTFSRQSLPVNYGNHTRPLLTVGEELRKSVAAGEGTQDERTKGVLDEGTWWPGMVAGGFPGEKTCSSFPLELTLWGVSPENHQAPLFHLKVLGSDCLGSVQTLSLVIGLGEVTFLYMGKVHICKICKMLIPVP